MSSTKEQINSNEQNTKFQTNCFGHLKLEIGIYLGFVIWNLGFKIVAFSD
jgi:hypothetical protein